MRSTGDMPAQYAGHSAANGVMKNISPPPYVSRRRPTIHTLTRTEMSIVETANRLR